MQPRNDDDDQLDEADDWDDPDAEALIPHDSELADLAALYGWDQDQ